MRTGQRLWAGSAAALIAAAGFGIVPAAHAVDSVIPDPQLAACVNRVIDPARPAEQAILPDDLANIREIRCVVSGSGVGSLAGLQHAVKLRALSLTGVNSLSAADALQPLAALGTLRELDLQDSQLTTLVPLSELVGLTQLTIGGNALTSLAGVEQMAQLKMLSANGNQLRDVDPLAGATALQVVTLGENQLESLAGLSGAAQLSQVWVNDNPSLQGRLEVFAGNTGLINVNISNTGATDLAVFAASPAMNTFQAVGNHISSLQGVPTGTTKVTLQQVTGRTLYVPVGATSHRIDVTGEVSMEDGVTLPDTIGRPAGGGVEPDPDPAVPFIRVKFGAEGERVSWGFDSLPAHRFNGTVTNPIVRVSIDGELPAFTAEQSGAGKVTVDHPGFVVDPAGGWVLGDDAPAFLTINPHTGEVSGTPPKPGSYTFTVSVRDELGNLMERELTLTVQATEVDPPVDPPIDPPVEPPVDPPVDPPVGPPAPPVTPPAVPTGPVTAPALAVTGAQEPAALWGAQRGPHADGCRGPDPDTPPPDLTVPGAGVRVPRG